MPRAQATGIADLLFRDAHETDFPAIAGLITNADELFRVFPAAKWPLDVRQIHRLAEQRLNLTVGCMENTIIAFANLYDLLPGQWAFIGNVIVHESKRGNGIGRILLDHMLELVFLKHALPEARLSVFSDNMPALQLYRTLGFNEYARETRKDLQNHRVTLLHLKRPQIL
jgi:ribosomal protein S18 acetylase RimI-like enzyme